MDTSTNRRRALRLREYDYTQNGAYFITLCAQDRVCLFGEVSDGAMQLNECGQQVCDSWLWLSKQYPYVLLDMFVVMPNHPHGVVVINSRWGGTEDVLPDTEGRSRTAPTKIKPLGRLIGAFKTVSTKSINASREAPQTDMWQRNYYEHVIRNEADLQRIREYIRNNPIQWELDEENPSYRRGGS